MSKNIEDPKKYILKELQKADEPTNKAYIKIINKCAKELGGLLFKKTELRSYYLDLIEEKELKKSKKLERFLRVKPVRTISGVTPVTVLTKPFKCPGKCIFCPSEHNHQPKSYLSSEPAAGRAQGLKFDPFEQVKRRIEVYESHGHSTDKIELIILGGTWSFYPQKYQIWFVLSCFDAMNNKESPTFTEKEAQKATKIELLEALGAAQNINEKAKFRNVGLSIETRPDFISSEHLKLLRQLGVTKMQMGVQSLDNEILRINGRGYTVEDVENAVKLIRLAGFKIHLHWMANLYGSNTSKDYKDFKKLFDKESIRPDELKIYPCSIIEGTPLYDLYQSGEHKPYSEKELLGLMTDCMTYIPEYCRVNRLFRDIPSDEIAVGIKKTNFRQLVNRNIEKKELVVKEIRSREIRSGKTSLKKQKFNEFKYNTNVSTEYFLSYVTEEDKLLGFLRLSLPLEMYKKKPLYQELQGSSMIREVHVYGKSQEIDQKDNSSVQHKGLGTQLVRKAEELAKNNGFNKISVISAIGTRNYYHKLGYSLGDLYMHKNLQ
jgi:elongator complex protein 3